MIVMFTALMVGSGAPPVGSETHPSSGVSIVGADFSSLPWMEANHQPFSDAGVVAPAEQILSVHGVNYSRIRIWVSSDSEAKDLDAALAVASRSAAAGMKILLDFHYSDTWAEPQNQRIPAAWENSNQEELVNTVRTYTEEVVRAFADQGTPAAMVQIGNEVTNGMLWAWGKIDLPWGEYWEGFASLYKAGVAGARAATPDKPPLIAIHYFYEEGSGPFEFFDNVEEHGMPFDVIGLTYYPFWGGSLNELARSMDRLATRYGKDILILETSYPWTVNDPANCPVVANSIWRLPDRWIYPPTPDGQAAYFNGLRDVLRRVPDGHGLGFFVWEPAWLPSTTLAQGTCNKYANTTLFDWYGRALPALVTVSE
ncbi:glycoside hydrolase family 53 protein [Kocuria rosea]|uniref:glycoside hydrolase family 53 protein n=1 Tax=Kocuria rosea TaxID=1275 RepID=UPI001F53FD9A|nr:glycosyl hydrolase 53 family protein [Kocuria rosea]